MAEQPDEPRDDEELTDEEYAEERSAQVRRTLLTLAGVVVALGLVVAIGTTLMVRSLDLDQGSATGATGDGTSPREPLPTTALPVPGETPEDTPTDLVTPKGPKKGEIELNIAPVQAGPMERVNLTGSYPGQDNVALKVQRLEGGRWSDFGVDAQVRVGTYETYIMTGRAGENRFRMFDQQADKASNEVRVTIG